LTNDNQSVFVDRINAYRELACNELTFPLSRLAHLSNSIVEVFQSGQKIAFVGNGGSAAEAIHLAAEFTGKCVVEHRPLPAICLNESQSAITAISNDFGIEHVFSRQVEAHMKENDLLIAMSTSGRSPNIINAIHKALNIGVKVILWTGSSEIVIANLDVWNVPSNSTPRIQEVHLAWGHILAESVELSI
jgi:D-sedoheptulose 7-phosphate isomerase